MFGFFKRKSVPEWASFMDERQYAEFIKALKSFLQSHGVRDYKINDGLMWFAGEGPFGWKQMGLQRLALLCSQFQPADYHGLMMHHFGIMKRAAESFPSFDVALQDFEKIRGCLGIRIQGDGFISLKPEGLVFRQIAEGLYAQLIYDLPDVLRNVHPSEAALWKRSEDELFELAQANIREEDEYSPNQTWVEREGSGFWMIAADGNFFAPNIVLDLERHEHLLGTQGAVVGVPNRHGALIHPIRSIKAVSIIGDLTSICNGMCTGPRSISPNLFWYKGGQFTKLPYVVKDDAVQLFFPDIFTDMLNTLPAEEESFYELYADGPK